MTKTPEELTADWKEGKLPQWKFYYVSYSGGIEPLLLNDENNFINHSLIVNPLIKSVLAPVPTYDEDKAMQDHISYLEKCISIYEQKEQLHTNDSIEYNKLEKENNNLRDLLRECKQHLYFQKKINNEIITLLVRINAAIGESEA